MDDLYIRSYGEGGKKPMVCEQTDQGRIEMKQMKFALRRYDLIGFGFIDFNDPYFQESGGKETLLI
jgi:hypothetical protein